MGSLIDRSTSAIPPCGQRSKAEERQIQIWSTAVFVVHLNLKIQSLSTNNHAGVVLKSGKVWGKRHFCCESPCQVDKETSPAFPSVCGKVDTDWLNVGVNYSFKGFLLKNELACFRYCIVIFIRVQRPCHSKEFNFSSIPLKLLRFLSLVYSQHQKCNVRVSLFKVVAFQLLVLEELTGETGGCLVYEFFEEPSTAVTLQQGTSCSVEISPHIGPLCIFTSTQPHSTPLKFILRRGPLKGHVAPFVSVMLLIKIAA